MKRLTKQWLSVTAAGLVFVAGCTATPQRRPDATAPAGDAAGSTTGDMNACAVALGNMVATGAAGTTGVNKGTSTGTPNPGAVSTPGVPDATGTAANGLPGHAASPGTPGSPTTAGTPGSTGPTGTAGGGGGGTAVAPPGATATPAPGTTPGTTATTPPGTPGTPGAAGTTTGDRVEITANGVLLGNVALVALPTMDNMNTTTLNGGPGPTGTTGAGNTAGAGDTTTGVTNTGPGANGGGGLGAGGSNSRQDLFRGNTTAIDKIRAACTRVTEIRVVNDSGDRARLAEIAQTIRQGAPITRYLDDVVALNRRATTAWTAGTTGATTGATTGGAGR